MVILERLPPAASRTMLRHAWVLLVGVGGIHGGGVPEYFEKSDCYFEKNGRRLYSGHELEDEILGDDSSWWPRLSRTSKYDSSLRPLVWESGNIDSSVPEEVMYEFTMYHYDIDEKLNVLRAHGFETYSWVDHRLNYSVPETCSRGTVSYTHLTLPTIYSV